MNDLLDLACQSGCQIVATLADENSTEKKHPEGASEFEQAVNTLGRPDVGLVMGWTVDSLGRSLQHLVITPDRDTPSHF